MTDIRAAARAYSPHVLLVAAASAWITLSGHDEAHAMLMMTMIGTASLIGSLAGFAFSAICGAMLFHLHDDPVRIVQVMITCSIANQAAMTWALRADINWRALTPYLAGGMLGLGPGVWALLHVDRQVYTGGLGAFLTIYGGYMLMRKPMVIQRKLPGMEFFVGFLGGITGGAAGFPSAFVAIWCGLQGWHKQRQRAIMQPFILIMQIVALLAIGWARHAQTTGQTFEIGTFLFIPASLLGTSLGLLLYQHLTDRQFGRAVNALLIISGLSYVA